MALAPAALEAWLEREREQLPLWVPVALVAGVAAWFCLPGALAWRGWLCACLGLAVLGLAFGGGGRLGRALAVAALAAALGCALTWARAEHAAAPRIARAEVVALTGTVERVEPLPARAAVRLLVRPEPRASEAPPPRAADAVARPARWRDAAADAPLPPRVRLTVDADKAPAGLARGARIATRARLVPPPDAAVPGAYSYAATAWFTGVGATGKALDPIRVTAAAPARTAPAGWLADARAALSAHIQARLPGDAGGVAAALATGDMGAVSLELNDAFRRSGLAHLLSVSGLHLSAAVGATMVLMLRLLALSPWLALRAPLPLVAAGVGALAGIAYTLLTGAEVPTVRSLVAALLVLGGVALGRETATLRLVAAGAMLVVLLWPEAAAGASFQLSFAAIVALVALGELDWTRRTFERREEGRLPATLRATAGLLLSGVVVELALMPIALFQFHRAGFYGAVANIVAIPLTTLVIMPAEAIALLLDLFGLGAPAWWFTGLSLRLLIALAHGVAALPGAVTLVPTLGRGGFALFVAGGLWLALWRTRVRLLGLAGIAAGAAALLLVRPPDLLVTGDGRHVALRTAAGDVALLRERTGDYVRDTLAELNGREGEAALSLSDLPDARCGPDSCAAVLTRDGRTWRVLALRSAIPIARAAFEHACAGADIVVSDRRLPGFCRPRWLRIDATLLARTGGLAVHLDPPRIETVAAGERGHPWAAAPAGPITIRRDRGDGRHAARDNVAPADATGPAPDWLEWSDDRVPWGDGSAVHRRGRRDPDTAADDR